MTIQEFADNWKSCGIAIKDDEGKEHIVKLVDRYMICWGVQRIGEHDAIFLDEGGEQGAPAVFLTLIEGNVYSVMPNDPHVEPIGPLVELADD